MGNIQTLPFLVLLCEGYFLQNEMTSYFYVTTSLWFVCFPLAAKFWRPTSSSAANSNILLGNRKGNNVNRGRIKIYVSLSVVFNLLRLDRRRVGEGTS